MFERKMDNYVFDWQDAFLIVSVEYLFELWDMLGLNFSDDLKPKLQQVARTAYTKFQDVHGHHYLADRTRIIEEALNAIEIEMGDSVKEALVFWHEYYVFLPRQEDPNFQLIEQWQQKLLSLYQRTLGIPVRPNVLGWSEERYLQLARLIELELDLALETVRKEFKNLEERLELLNFDDCQEWDKDIFTEQVNEYGHLGVLCSNMEFIAEGYYFHRFWELFEREFSFAEVYTVVSWIVNEANQVEWQHIPPLDRYKYIPPSLRSLKYLI